MVRRARSRAVASACLHRSEVAASGVLVSMRLSSGHGLLWCRLALSLGGPSRSRPTVLLARGLRTPVRLPSVSPAEPMSGSVVLDAAGRRRSPATMPGFHAGHPPRNKGLRYLADAPTVEEIVAVMRIAGDGLHGRRLRGLIVVLWRAGLRIDEALALREGDLDRRRGSILVRRGKGGRRREIGMDDWGWQELEAWLIASVALPIGPLFCIVNGRTRGRPWTTSGARAELRRAAARAGVRRRFAPHQLRHAHAVEMAREGVPLIVIQRQLGHSNLGITSVYLQGIDNAEIIETVHARRAPMVPVTTSRPALPGTIH